MIKKLTCAVVLLLFAASSASADTILKFSLSEVDSDILYEGGELFTPSDGDLSTPGDQNTALNFTGFLDGLFTDIEEESASFTLDSVVAVGDASLTAGIIAQQTDGGTFSIWDDNNELLLSAELGEGAISGSANASTGSFFNTEVVNYTGGSLLAFVLPSPGGISLSLASIMTNGEVGLRILNDELQDFQADANGLVTGEPIPEPSTVALFLTGLMGGALTRRKKKA